MSSSFSSVWVTCDSTLKQILLHWRPIEQKYHLLQMTGEVNLLFFISSNGTKIKISFPNISKDRKKKKCKNEESGVMCTFQRFNFEFVFLSRFRHHHHRHTSYPSASNGVSSPSSNQTKPLEVTCTKLETWAKVSISRGSSLAPQPQKKRSGAHCVKIGRASTGYTCVMNRLVGSISTTIYTKLLRMLISDAFLRTTYNI